MNYKKNVTILFNKFVSLNFIEISIEDVLLIFFIWWHHVSLTTFSF